MRRVVRRFSATLYLVAGVLCFQTITAAQVVTGKVLGGIQVKTISIGGPVAGGNPATAVVELTAAPDPTNPAVSVSLTSSNPAVATVPATLLIRSRSTSQNFEVKTAAVSAPTEVTISAKTTGLPAKATLLVNRAQLASLNCSPAQVQPDQVVQCDACLDGLSKTEWTVAFKSTPGTLIVGEVLRTLANIHKCATVSPSHWAVLASPVTTTITATREGVSKSTTVKLLPRVIQRFDIPDSDFVGGSTVTAWLRFPAPTPQGIVLDVATSAPLNVPAKLPVPAGVIQFSFPIGTSATPVSQVIKLTVSTQFFGYSEAKADLLRIRPARLNSIEILDSQALVNIPLGGREVAALLKLSDPGGGVKVKLAYSNMRQLSGPSELIIAGTDKEAAFTIRVQPCPASPSCTENVTAMISGVGDSIVKPLSMTSQ